MPGLQLLGAVSIFLALLAWRASVPAIVAAEPARLVMTPMPASPDGYTRVVVSVEGLPGGRTFNGFELLFTFDASVARGVGVEPASGWNTELVPPTVAAGSVRVVALTLSPACASSCELLTLVLGGVEAGGTTPLAISEAKLAAGGFEIEATSSPVTVSMEAAPELPFRAVAPALASDRAP